MTGLARSLLLKHSSIGAQDSWRNENRTSPTSKSDGNRHHYNTRKQCRVDDVLFGSLEETLGQICTREKDIEASDCITKRLSAAETTYNAGRGRHTHHSDEGGKRAIS